jgi:hypothetical protein
MKFSNTKTKLEKLFLSLQYRHYIQYWNNVTLGHRNPKPLTFEDWLKV